MKSKSTKLKSILYFIFPVFIFVFTLFSGKVLAQSVLKYPITELGYCRDAKECYLYCEVPENKPACWSYGKYVLGEAVLGEHTTSDAEIESQARELGITFPIEELGNCASASECRSYCDQPENREACISFARERGIGQYEEHQRMLEAARGELGCNSFESCQAYCEQPENKDRCMEFATRFAPPKMRERIQNLKQSMQEHLGCGSFSECQSYCDSPDNIEACMRFAESQMPEEFRQKYLKHKQRTVEIAREQGIPCTSFETCRDYCKKTQIVAGSLKGLMEVCK